MSKLGKKLIKGLEDALSGKPLKHSIVRRMVVKGKTEYVRESYYAPLKLTDKYTHIRSRDYRTTLCLMQINDRTIFASPDKATCAECLMINKKSIES